MKTWMKRIHFYKYTLGIDADLRTWALGVAISFLYRDVELRVGPLDIFLSSSPSFKKDDCNCEEDE